MTEQQLDAQIRALQQQKQQLRSRKMWTCTKCDKRTSLSKLIVVEKYWYESPHGCTGGDTWRRSDEYLVLCPKCNTWVRVYAQRVSHWSADNERHRQQLQRERNPEFYFLHDHIEFVQEKLDFYPHGNESISLDKLRQEQQRGYY